MKKLIILLSILAVLSGCASAPKPSFKYSTYSEPKIQSIQRQTLSKLNYQDRQLLQKWSINLADYQTIYEALDAARTLEQQAIAARRERQNRELDQNRELERQREQQALAWQRAQQSRSTGAKVDCSLSAWDLLPVPGPWKLLTLAKINKIRKLRQAGRCR